MEHELLDLEREFWEASSRRDGNFYRTQVDDDALYVFPGPTGTLTKEECARIVEANDAPWAWFRFDDTKFIELAEGVVLLTYTSHSQRDGADPMSMRITTIYRVADDGWKLVFHQQTLAPTP